MKKTLDKNQKRNLKVVYNVCREADYLSQKNKANYYVIQEYENISLFTEDQFNVVKDDYSCKKCGWIGENSERKTGCCPDCGSKVENFVGSEFFVLVYTIKYKNPVNTFDEAKADCDKFAEETGGIWHVIEVIEKRIFRDKKTFTRVHDNYMKKNPNVKSLYKVGCGEMSDEHLKKLGFNRAERRNILKKVS